MKRKRKRTALKMTSTTGSNLGSTKIGIMYLFVWSDTNQFSSGITYYNTELLGFDVSIVSWNALANRRPYLSLKRTTINEIMRQLLFGRASPSYCLQVKRIKMAGSFYVTLHAARVVFGMQGLCT
eukprot:1158395-Pelagomonas_calceolata.AAC.5